MLNLLYFADKGLVMGAFGNILWFIFGAEVVKTLD